MSFKLLSSNISLYEIIPLLYRSIFLSNLTPHPTLNIFGVSKFFVQYLKKGQSYGFLQFIFKSILGSLSWFINLLYLETLFSTSSKSISLVKSSIEK